MDWPRRCGSPVCPCTPGRRAQADPAAWGVAARRRSAGAPCRAGPRSWSVTTCWRAVLHLRYLHESWRRFPTSHEFRGNRDGDVHGPSQLPRHWRTTRSPGNDGPRSPTAPWWSLHRHVGPLNTRHETCICELDRRRWRGISVPESPHCRTEWHPRSFATISPQIAQRMSLTRCWQRLPLPRPRKKEMTVCPAGNELATTRKYGEG